MPKLATCFLYGGAKANMTRSILGKLEQITANKVMREVDGGVELGAITASRFRSFGEGPFVCGGGQL
ncbi:hypothetical protein HMPREF3122_05575 [Corynebacterium sp. HMSC11H10]|nr:hypothetical protein HMPREF3122_05575 [Corynebacterium sp. HMSC11H10]